MRVHAGWLHTVTSHGTVRVMVLYESGTSRGTARVMHESWYCMSHVRAMILDKGLATLEADEGDLAADYYPTTSTCLLSLQVSQ